MSQRRPSGPATCSATPVASPSPRSAARRPAGRARRCGPRALLVGLLTGAVLLGAALPAGAAPRNPSDEEIGAAQTEQEAAAAEVGRIAALVAGAEAELERVGVQAEAAGTAYLAAEEALLAAQAAAAQTAADLEAAQALVLAAQARIAEFSRDSYMQGSAGLSTSAALLDSAGPGELIQRAALLSYVADNQVDALDQLEVARIQQANADSAARQARDQMAAAEESARAAKQAADAQLAAQQQAFEQVAAQKADYEQQLQAAQIRLLELQGARDAYQQWVAEKEAAEAAARAEAERAAREAAAAAAAAAARDQAAGNGGGGGGGGSGSGGGAPSGSNYVFPTSGWISSCFGWRWGALHGGVDIAAPVGTNIYSVTSGTVVRNGYASGFGLALYIRGDDGAVTVYGHVNREFVSAGERVHAGQLIAEVGNRGNSTGPHLHFEVHPSGAMHGGQVNPMPWLRARGVDVGGC